MHDVVCRRLHALFDDVNVFHGGLLFEMRRALGLQQGLLEQLHAVYTSALFTEFLFYGTECPCFL